MVDDHPYGQLTPFARERDQCAQRNRLGSVAVHKASGDFDRVKAVGIRCDACGREAHGSLARDRREHGLPNAGIPRRVELETREIDGRVDADASVLVEGNRAVDMAECTDERYRASAMSDLELEGCAARRGHPRSVSTRSRCSEVRHHSCLQFVRCRSQAPAEGVGTDRRPVRALLAPSTTERAPSMGGEPPTTRCGCPHSQNTRREPEQHERRPGDHPAASTGDEPHALVSHTS